MNVCSNKNNLGLDLRCIIFVPGEKVMFPLNNNSLTNCIQKYVPVLTEWIPLKMIRHCIVTVSPRATDRV